MTSTTDFAETAALAGDPARASMLLALMDGRALTAGELASVAGVTPQTASGHLARLVGAGLLAVETQGRHRYHRLASPLVARMVETILSLAGGADARPVRVGPRDSGLRLARTCYDHLAGRVAVEIAERMVEAGGLVLGSDGGELTEAGRGLLADAGVEVPAAGGRRAFCRPCLDWSERRYHLAGVVGAALLDGLVARGWLRRMAASRAVAISPAGERGLRAAFGIDLRASAAAETSPVREA
jgi:DNA-binding transcriptional ArsR family regulator